MNGVIEDEIWQYIGIVLYFDFEEFYSVCEFYYDIINVFYGKQQYLFNLLWEMLVYNFQFCEVELIFVNGVNGYGKMEVVGYMVFEVMRQGVKICVVLFELKFGILFKCLIWQFICCKMLLVLEIELVFKFYDDWLWLFGLIGIVKVECLIEIFIYVRW